MTIAKMVANEFTMRAIETHLRRRVVLTAIKMTGNKSRAAKHLGIHRNTITRILEGK